MDVVPQEVFRWARVVAYPHGDRELLQRRFTELRLLGVTQLLEEGRVDIYGLRVLGKGTVGLVVKAVYVDGSTVAVKIRRTDASRDSLLREAEILKFVNKVGVGPRLRAASRNMLVWDYLDAVQFEEWIASRPSREVCHVLLELLHQLWLLDRLGVAHNELSRPTEHVLVTKEGKPVLVDFESASLNKFRANISQFLSFLLNEHSRVAGILREKVPLKVAREELVTVLRNYKKGLATLEDVSEILLCPENSTLSPQ